MKNTKKEIDLSNFKNIYLNKKELDEDFVMLSVLKAMKAVNEATIESAIKSDNRWEKYKEPLNDATYIIVSKLVRKEIANEEYLVSYLQYNAMVERVLTKLRERELEILTLAHVIKVANEAGGEQYQDVLAKYKKKILAEEEKDVESTTGEQSGNDE